MNFVARYDILCPNRHSAEHEFENKIHGYLHMEEEPDFSLWNFAFDPLLPLFRPYDPNFLIARRRTIDPELWAFLDEGIEPRQYVRQRPGTDDLAFRRGKLWVGVGLFSVGLAAPAVWAILTAVSSGWIIALNILATALLVGIPIRWNYQILIKKRGFPKGVRLMEAGRTLLVL